MTQRKRLAMVACHGPAEGPWAFARGSEYAVNVIGERVVMEMVTSTAETEEHSFPPGTHPFPSGSKFRFIKPERGAATTVEVLFE